MKTHHKDNSGKTALGGLLLAPCVLLLLIPLVCRAACPDQPAVLYIPSPAGSQIDMLYRPLREAWDNHGAHQLQVTPMPGRGGSYALSRLLREAPGSCALAAIQLPSFLFLSQTQNRMVTGEDVSPVAMFAFVPHALWVEEGSPFQSAGEMAERLRNAGDDGTSPLALAGVGSYTDQHLASLAFERLLGVKGRYHALADSAEAAARVKEKKAHACWGYALPRASMPGMRPLAVAANARSPALPDVPTFREQNLDLVSGSHFGIAMAASVTEEIRREVAERVILLMADPALRRHYTAQGVAPLSLSYEDMRNFMEMRSREAEKLLKDYPLIPPTQRRHTGL